MRTVAPEIGCPDTVATTPKTAKERGGGVTVAAVGVFSALVKLF